MAIHGIIRQLQVINGRKRSPQRIDRRLNFSNIVSFIALIASLLSIFFQFFYEKYDLNAALIDATVYKDSISLDLIYHNKGNQDATILSSAVFFYSDKNKLNEDNHIEFESDRAEPYILPPGKQIFNKLNQRLYFDAKDILADSNTDNKDTLRVGLKINYLNDKSLQSEVIKECGWITLDSLNNTSYWRIQYQLIALDSDEYFISGYKPKTND